MSATIARVPRDTHCTRHLVKRLLSSCVIVLKVAKRGFEGIPPKRCQFLICAFE